MNTGFKPQELHDSPTILPMISRGFSLVCSPELRYKGLPAEPVRARSESSTRDGFEFTIPGIGHPFRCGYDELRIGLIKVEVMKVVELAFEELGSPDDAPLIILHGFFASSRNWRQIAEKLAARFHVYVPDMRNHGASPHHPIMDYPAMAADLLQFMNARGLTTAHLLGHSMGGKVAMWLALNHPERTDQLIVVDIAPVSYKHSFDLLIQALKALPLHEISNRKQAELLLAPAIPELSYRQFLLQNLVLKDGMYCWRIDLDTFCRMAPNIAAFPAALQLAPFTGKTLFLAGEDSGYVKADDIKVLFPAAALSIIANAGHWLHVQQPNIFIEQVEQFLKSTGLGFKPIVE